MPECSADPRPAMTTPTGELGTGRRTASPTTGSPGTRSHPSGPWTHGRTHGRAHAQCQHQHHQHQHHHHDQLINVRCTSSSPVPPASAERNQANPRRPSPYFFSFLHRVSPKKNKFRRGFSSASFDRLEPGCDWWVFLWQGSVVLFSTMEMSATATPDWLRPRRECVCGCGRRSETTGRHRHSNEHWMRCERRRPLATDLITTDPSRLNESTWASWASSSTPFDHYPVSLVFLRFCYRCRCVFHCAALSCPRFYRGLPGITGFWNDSTVLQLFSSSNYVPLGLLGLVLLHPSCLLSCTRLLMGCWWIHCMLPSLSSMLLGFWMDGPLSLSIISMTFN